MTREYGSVASCQLPVASCQSLMLMLQLLSMLFVQLGYSYSVPVHVLPENYNFFL